MAYMMELKHQKKWIDATNALDRRGRYVNDKGDGSANGTLKLNHQGFPWIIALRDIAAGNEIVFDYGNKPSNMAWRKPGRVQLIPVESQQSRNPSPGPAEKPKPIFGNNNKDVSDVSVAVEIWAPGLITMTPMKRRLMSTRMFLSTRWFVLWPPWWQPMKRRLMSTRALMSTRWFNLWPP